MPYCCSPCQSKKPRYHYFIWNLFLFVFLGSFLTTISCAEELGNDINIIAIQEGGRIKPLDTFAREQLKLITGKSSWNQERPSLTLLKWYINQEQTLAEPLIEILDHELLKELGWSKQDRYYSLTQVSNNKQLEQLVTSGHNKTEEERSRQEEKAQKVWVQAHRLSDIIQGKSLTIIPTQQVDEAWHSLAIIEQASPQYQEAWQSLKDAIVSDSSSSIETAVTQWNSTASQSPGYPQVQSLERESFYNSFHPFRKAWICYLLGFLCFLAIGQTGSKLYIPGLALTCFGFALHTFGFYLRVMIAGRAPVTNMYESVIWVAWGVIFFALVFSYHSGRSKAKNYLLAATFGATVCMILCDNLPTVLNPAIEPLVPVLRNNFWLTVHVLTITLSYAAFLLALGIGHIMLWNMAFKNRTDEQVQQSYDALYRSLQVGVLLLAAGTLLGGVWAAQSWGRFWGWDPKEVWALIALLGYLAILHARHAKLLDNFGVAAWSILAFQLVIMAWYGVNFVLGAGLHSYGFGTGGVEVMSVLVLIEVVFVLVCWVRYRKNQQTAQEQKG